MIEKDVIVVGAGVGGVSAALSAARNGSRTLLIERESEIGGTGVHSPVSCICTFRAKHGTGFYIHKGVHRELFPEAYEPSSREVHTYDEKVLLKRYKALIANEPNLEVLTGESIVEVIQHAGQILELRSESGQHFRASVFVDSTANGNLSHLAGAETMVGNAKSGLMQPATLVFRVSGIDLTQFKTPLPYGRVERWDEWSAVKKELAEYYQPYHAEGKTSNPRSSVLFFPYPYENDAFLFNQTRITGVRPWDTGSVEAAMEEGRKQIAEFWSAVSQHPAMAKAKIEFIANKLGEREGRRVVGDYVLTEEDCLGEARFEDMVASCGYPLDIHNPEGDGTVMTPIPGSGYYHIPYRCIRVKGFSNLLTGSRCISGSHEAHSSYRVMAPLTTIGMAAGVAAALHVRHDGDDVREVHASQIRFVLDQMGEFTEGSLLAPEPVVEKRKKTMAGNESLDKL